MIAIVGKPSEINEKISMPASIDTPVAVSQIFSLNLELAAK